MGTTTTTLTTSVSSTTTSTTTTSTTMTTTTTTTATTTATTTSIPNVKHMTNVPKLTMKIPSSSSKPIKTKNSNANPTTPSLIDKIKNIVYNTKDVKPTQNIPNISENLILPENKYLGFLTNNLTRNTQIDLHLPSLKESHSEKTKIPLIFQPTFKPKYRPQSTTSSSQITINLLDWLASKSKLRKQKKSDNRSYPESTTQMQTIVKSINGDVFQYIEDSLDDVLGASDILESESLLQVTMPNISTHNENLISNDIIYYDHELTEDMVAEPSEVKFIVYPSKDSETDTFLEFVNNNTAGKDVSDDDDDVEVITASHSEVTDEQIEDVMNHNTKLVGILKNTLEM